MTRTRSPWLGLALALLATLNACSEEPGPDTYAAGCTAGDQRSCICYPAINQGTQVCQVGGLYSPCSCNEGASGASGKGGAGGGKGGAGGSKGGAGGSAGTGGKSGASGSSGNSNSGGSWGTWTPLTIGGECEDDVDCGPGGKCLQTYATDLFEGGPPNGHCTTDCTAWLVLSEEEKATVPYACEPYVDITDPNAPLSRICVNVAAPEEPARAYCFLRCTFGQPKVEEIGKLDPDKCNGRDDTVCYSGKDVNGVYPFSFCRPFCQSDAQCDDLKCDRESGVCKASVPVRKKNGDFCDLKVLPDGSPDPDAPSDCEGGFCSRLFASNDPTVPEAHKNLGVCIDPCIHGSLESCGGPSNGLCLFTLFEPIDFSGAPVAVGVSDLAGCIKAVPSGQDTECPWQVGWFLRTLDPKLPPVCVPATRCAQDAGCAPTCDADEDCGDGKQCACLPGDTCDCDPTKDAGCSPRRCTLDGQPDVGNLQCRSVPEVCGKGFCLDHAPQGLPIGDPLVLCGK